GRMVAGNLLAPLCDGYLFSHSLCGSSDAGMAPGSNRLHSSLFARSSVCSPANLAPDKLMKDLTQGSVVKHLFQMIAFLAVSMVVQTLYLFADLYWVGHLGKEAIAAVGVAGNLTMIVLALTQMLGVGTTTLISQATGRKDQVHAELVFNQSWILSL